MTGSNRRFGNRRLSLWSLVMVGVGTVGLFDPCHAESHDDGSETESEESFQLRRGRRRRASTADDLHNPYWDVPWRTNSNIDAADLDGKQFQQDNQQAPLPELQSTNANLGLQPENPLPATSFPYSHWASVNVNIDETSTDSSSSSSSSDTNDNSVNNNDEDPRTSFPLSHWASVHVLSEKNVSSTNEEVFLHTNERPPTAQDLFVSQCLTLLDAYSVNGEVDRQSYVNFLMTLSRNSLQVHTFQDLPLFLSMIFFSASCTSGEDCVTLEPAITVHPKESPENQLNDLLCLQLMRFPFLEIALPFQFLIRVANGLTANDVLEGDNNETSQIVPTLEAALDQVLLEGFNCSHEPGQTRRRVKPDPKRRQPQPQNACDFIVQVAVEDAADYPCGFSSSCILIFSDVSVYAVLSEALDEPQLRSLTTTVLRDAINGDALSRFLRR